MSDQPHPTPEAVKGSHAPARELLASIRAYRKLGGAIVTIERRGRTSRRHRISLRRYAALREWTVTRAPRHWCTSGWWGRSSISVSLWSAS